jgi:hypothetical protein
MAFCRYAPPALMAGALLDNVIEKIAWNQCERDCVVGLGKRDVVEIVARASTRFNKLVPETTSISLIQLVGAGRFERPTPCAQGTGVCSKSSIGYR